MAEETDLQPNEVEEDGASAEVNEAPENNNEEVSSEASDEVSPESLASELGWSPRDNWRGNEDDWVDAKTFLKSTVDINKSLRRDLKATRDSAERAARAAAAITEQALEKQRQELLAARSEAFQTGDAEAFNRADKQLHELPQATQPGQPIETREFQQRNAGWYGIDPIATQIAFNVCEMHARNGADPASQLEAAEREVRKRFPEYFEVPKQAKAPANVEAPTSRSAAPPRKGPKGFNDLPPEAKKAALDFEKRNRATKEEYAKYYWQENA